MTNHLSIRRLAAVTPDPSKISGVTFMLVLNQQGFERKQILSIEKTGNVFELIYLHDATKETGAISYGGLIFMDENQVITMSGEHDTVSDKYIGKFDLAGATKHVFLQA